MFFNEAKMGPSPIPSIIHTITSGTMLNFKSGNNDLIRQNFNGTGNWTGTRTGTRTDTMPKYGYRYRYSWSCSVTANLSWSRSHSRSSCLWKSHNSHGLKDFCIQTGIVQADIMEWPSSRGCEMCCELLDRPWRGPAAKLGAVHNLDLCLCNVNSCKQCN